MIDLKRWDKMHTFRKYLPGMIIGTVAIIPVSFFIALFKREATCLPWFFGMSTTQIRMYSWGMNLIEWFLIGSFMGIFNWAISYKARHLSLQRAIVATLIPFCFLDAIVLFFLPQQEQIDKWVFLKSFCIEEFFSLTGALVGIVFTVMFLGKIRPNLRDIG